MKLLLLIMTYGIYAIFCGRFLMRALLWYEAAKPRVTVPPSARSSRFPLYAITLVDVLFFRRLFITNKILWVFSWTFHLAFFFVLLRHLRYFLQPVPGAIAFLLPVGVLAGYVLPFALLSLILYRILKRKDTYISKDNFFILGLVLFISVTGLAMRIYARPDLADVKEFILGLLTFRPDMPPDNFMFIAHFLAVLVLIPFLPSHVFVAPFVMMAAERRKEELEIIIHEK